MPREADVVEPVRAVAARVATTYGLEVFDVQGRRVVMANIDPLIGVLYRAGGNGQTTRLTGQGSRVNVTAPPAGHG